MAPGGHRRRAIFGPDPPRTAADSTEPEDARVTTRSTATRALSAIAVLALVACGDGRLTKLSVGMPKDSLAAVMQMEPHRTATYMLNGKVWDFSVYPTAKTEPNDSVPWRKMSPVVMIDGKVVGWGWGWWDKESTKLGIARVPEAGK
jgi:hypothetical protein